MRPSGLREVFDCRTDTRIPVHQYDVTLLQSHRNISYRDRIQPLITRQLFTEKGSKTLTDDTL